MLAALTLAAVLGPERPPFEIPAGPDVAAAEQMSEPREALDGIDPVLLIQGKEVQGKTDLKVVRDQFEYLFATPETKATFEKTPEKYEIQLGGACARMGGGVTGNPSDYAVVRRQDLHLRQRRLPQEVRRRAGEVPAASRRRRCPRPARGRVAKGARWSSAR